MNIFWLDNDPVACAAAHCDKHLVKMPVEYAQLLSTVCRLNGIEAGYRPTHVGHPCTLWAGASRANWRSLRTLALALGERYALVYGRWHRSTAVAAALPEPTLPDSYMPRPLCMPDDCKREHPVTAYREYYLRHKREIAEWRLGAPDWWS